MAANSSAVCPGVMRSKHPHSLRIGNLLGRQGPDLAALVQRHQHAAHRHGLAHGADVLAHVGQHGPHGRVEASHGQVGQVEEHRADHVDHGRHVGQDRREEGRDETAAVLPGRGADAVSVDQPKGAPRVVVRELDGDGTAHRVPHEDGRSRIHLVHDGHDLIGQVLNGDVLPFERIAAAESGQAGVDDPPAELLGQAGTLAPVHAAPGEEAVDVDGPDRWRARTVGTVRIDVVGNGEAQTVTVHHDGARAPCGWSGSCGSCGCTDRARHRGRGRRGRRRPGPRATARPRVRRWRPRSAAHPQTVHPPST